MGHKANYARVPMCHEHHIEHQHQHGEVNAYGSFMARHSTNRNRITVEDAKEWFDKKRIEYVQAWGWETTKAAFGYESWKDVPPQELRDWATGFGIEQYLPSEYR